MAHDQKQQKEKIVYVGDSRVRQNREKMLPADYTSYPGKTEAFVPNFLLKEWMVGAVFLVGYMALIIAHDPPLGYPADPMNTNFIPMPDWYFLFMYQLLKYPYMAEDYLVFGTLVIPGLAFGGLMLAPFLDRGTERRWFKRPVASSLMFLSLAALVYLTYVSWDHYTNELEARDMVPEHIERAQLVREGKEVPGVDRGGGEAAPVAIVAEDHEGADIYQISTCIGCHATDMTGQSGMPSLRGIGDKHSRDELVTIMKEGYGTGMGPQWDWNMSEGLTEEQLYTLADWLAMQKAEPEE